MTPEERTEQATTQMQEYFCTLARNISISLGIEQPSIDTGLNSVDVHWRTDRFEFLLSVPTDDTKEAGFYGDNYSGGSKIKGKLKPGVISSVLAAMTSNTIAEERERCAKIADGCGPAGETIAKAIREGKP